MSDEAKLAEPAPKTLPEAVAASALPAGFFTHEDVKASTFARILLLGAMKIGKTTAVLSTAPKPLLINCDGESATLNPAAMGAEFMQVDVTNRASWLRARKGAAQLVKEGRVETVILDTLSLLSRSLLEEIKITLDGFDRFRELSDQVTGGVAQLAALPAHLIVISHMDAGNEKAEGILPLVQGESKRLVPAMLADWILFRLDPDTQQREFVLGNQGKWTASGRNVRRVCTVRPTVPALFAELGIALHAGAA